MKKKPSSNQPTASQKQAKQSFIRPRVTKKHREPEVISGDLELESVPRITNDNLEKHRKEVLKGGRKLVYPIIHTPRRIVFLSSVVALASALIFMSYTVLRLYRFNDYSSFVHRVTEVIPFPVAKVGSSFVGYEDYLFELRRYVHYYESQQGVDFSTSEGQSNLDQQRRIALQAVIDNAYIKKLARQNNIVVEPQEVDAEISLRQQQGKLGDAETTEDVLQDFFGWNLDDYRRSVRQELLRQKVVAFYDQDTFVRAKEALARLDKGDDFADVAADYSDDLASAADGGDYGYLLDIEERSEEPRVLQEIFNLETGQHSDIINAGYRLEIVKVLDISGDKRQAAHISFYFADIEDQVNDLKQQQPTTVYINVDLDE